MAIDRFSRQEFEDRLSQIMPAWEGLGLIDGEREYVIPVNAQARLLIRSSIDDTGVAADTGEDSIRLYVQAYQANRSFHDQMRWFAAGKKLDAYTTRVPGWGNRLEKKVRTLWDRASRLTGTIPTTCDCGDVYGVFFVNKETKNKGRPFASCWNKNCNQNSFTWLDNGSAKVVKFEEVEACELAPNAEPAEQPKTEQSKPKPVSVKSSASSGAAPTAIAERTGSISTGQPKSSDVNPGRDESQIDAARAALRNRGGSAPKQVSEVPKPKAAVKANDSQQAAIDADPNANVRVMAPPGSGKTFVLEHRYQQLVDASISPTNILVVTFTKAMADEMGHRIKARVPSAELTQISTIHAFCFRLLTMWDTESPYQGWQVPKDWQVRKEVETLIEKHWEVYSDEEELPNSKEVIQYIDSSKNHGLTLEESKPWFVKVAGQRFGEYLYLIRRDLDRAVDFNRWMRFADMLYFTEQMMKHNARFRARWQKRFTHVIVDEAQDTNYQALRILITISMDIGQHVY